MLDHRPILRHRGDGWPDWPQGPVLRGRWRAAPRTAIDTLVATCARSPDAPALPVPIIRMRLLRPSFYPGWILAEGLAAWSEEDLGVFHLLIGRDACLRLDGKGGEMTRLMMREIRLGGDAAVDEYLRFFCAVTHGEEGPFRIVETSRDLAFAPGGEARLREARAARVGRMTRVGSGPPWGREACVAYGGTLFRCRFTVASDGTCTMEKDDPLVSDVLCPPRTSDGWFIFGPGDAQAEDGGAGARTRGRRRLSRDE
jgi:hypothetical protein